MRIVSLFVLSLFMFSFCSSAREKAPDGSLALYDSIYDSVAVNDMSEPADRQVYASDIVIEKELLYDQYTLADSYPYKDTVRQFQWDKIRERLAIVDNLSDTATWGILQNYKNGNREAPVVRDFVRNDYNRVSDQYGVERYQSVPLYVEGDSIPFRYGRDGSPVRIIQEGEKTMTVETENFPGQWEVPSRYVKIIGDTIVFDKVVFVDRTNQNICTLEKSGGKWLVRSMNPATTGVHKPPYAQETPEGFFFIQLQKVRMIYLRDGSSAYGGFSPWASRFTNGAYLHGVPVNAPHTQIVEFSATLGTIPRSHMCVRNATSHAKFIYDWVNVQETLVFVFD